MALQRRALPGTGTGLTAHAAEGGGCAGRGKVLATKKSSQPASGKPGEG